MAVDLSATPIHCTVEVERAPAGVHLRGRIVSQRDASGDYHLQIVKSGRSGSSRIGQGGRFEAKAHTPIYVGAATMDFGEGAQLSARLTVLSGGGSYSCETHKEAGRG